MRLKRQREASEKARIQRERMERQAARVATPTTNVVEEDSPQTQQRKRRRKLEEDNFNDISSKKRRKDLMDNLPTEQGLEKKGMKFKEKFSTVSPRS